MAHSKISTTVTASVTLATGRYLDRVVVGKTGVVAPVSYGATAIYAPAADLSARLTNRGTITGGVGSASGSYGRGGAGIVFAASGTIINDGVIVGGAAGFMASNDAGGIGVDLLSSGDVINGGTISGGAASYKGPAGDAVYLGAGGTLTNTGTIAGGNIEWIREQAGLGVHAAANGVVINGGVILGGSANVYDGAPGYAAAGVYLAAGGKLTNTGTIVGGNSRSYYNGAGAAGVDLGVRGLLRNQGMIAGGAGGPLLGGRGGDGADAGASGAVLNTGSIAGGSGGAGESPDRGGGGPGGTGIFLASGGKLINGGTVAGGAGGFGDQGGGDGGSGVNVVSGGVLTNSGTIAGGSGGGAGGSFDGGGGGGAGGNGVFLQAGGTLTSFGLIAGGAGGYSGYDASNQVGGVAGPGGAGVDISGGAVLIVSGSVTGGAGGNAGIYNGIVGTPGYGGAGVEISGNGTLIVSGAVFGGAGGTAVSGPAGATGDAVQFGNAAATLVVKAGAVFNGLVAANANVADTLDLAGDQAGTLTGLGSQFSGFSSVTVDTKSTWTLVGTNMLTKDTHLVDGGVLSVTGALNDGGAVRVDRAADLRVAGTGVALLNRLALAGGTVSDGKSAILAVGDTASGADAGMVTVQKGAMLSGFGTISGDVLNHGTILAIGGTLTLDAALNGGGLVAIAGGATLVAQSQLGPATFDGAATLVLGAPRMAHGPISGFGTGDVIDVQKLAATSTDFQNGTLSLIAGAITDRIVFDGTYTLSDFSFGSDGNGGTDVMFASGGERHLATRVSPGDEATGGIAGWGQLHYMV